MFTSPFSDLFHRVRRGATAALLALTLLCPSAVEAAVDITFFSREFGASFPHAFVRLEGVDDRTGQKIDENHGFTATHISPAILLGSVRGDVMAVDEDYIAKSDPHFTFTLSESELDQVLAVVQQWRQLSQPSYNLNRQNCVYFVASVAASLGMVADTPRKLMKKPRSYTESLTRANRDWLQGRGAVIHRDSSDER